MDEDDARALRDEQERDRADARKALALLDEIDQGVDQLRRIDREWSSDLAAEARRLRHKLERFL